MGTNTDPHRRAWTGRATPAERALFTKHGGYRKLLSFQVAQLIYDVTVRFCERYVSWRSRTRDQMVQAARCGRQNIGEGSQASSTSGKMELKLTNVARASLEELRLDYEDFLRQHELPVFPPNHPALMRFKSRRCKSLGDVRAWVDGERRLASVRVSAGSCASVSVPSSCLVANAALSLLNLCCYLLDRQLAAQARAFLEEGGFSERLTGARRRGPPPT